MARIQFKDHYYEGEVNDKGEPHGHGICHYNSGCVFEGTFADGKENGPGKCTYADGQILETNFVDGVENGHCRWYLNGKITSEGDYLNGKKNGYWSEDCDEFQAYAHYVDDLREGHVFFFYNDGAAYEYEAKNGKENGPSFYCLNDGFSSAGNYRDGLETGHWIDYFPNNGSYQYGEYVDGKQEGYWTAYYPNGDITRQRFHKGFPRGRIEVITKDGDEISVGIKGGAFSFRGKTADGMRFGLSTKGDGKDRISIRDSDGTRIKGRYSDGDGQITVSDKDGSAELDLTGGKVNSSEYKEKKKGFLSRLFGKR